MRALVAGCGYTGLRLARRLVDENHEVVGTTRDPGRTEEIAASGARPLVIEADDPRSTLALEEVAPDVCFFLIPPAPLDRDPDAGRLARVVRALHRAPLECFIYASSTGVYGDRGADPIDESVLPRPESDRARARLASERRLLELGWRYDCRPRIGRIGGIYGPGRTLGIRSGRYHLIAGHEGWSSRIHVDDLVTALIAVWQRGMNGRLYNLCDDEPHPSSEFARLAARLLDIDLPEITEEAARRVYSPDRVTLRLASRRVSNRRLREELAVTLRYPSFREGLPAALSSRGRAPRESPPGSRR